MDRITAYLFARTIPDGATGAERRRLQALQALRDELIALGTVTVTATPEEADVQVEITDVVAGAAHRVVMVRLSADDEPLDFVCSDGSGSMTAEHQAARRIHAWMHQWSATHEQRVDLSDALADSEAAATAPVAKAAAKSKSARAGKSR